MLRPAEVVALVHRRLAARADPGIFIHLVPQEIFLADRVVVMEPGPGRIASEHRITLPRPRDVASPEFNDVRRDLSARLHSHHAKKAA
jgi:NitT/TauT family transport system ATP-binding protein